MRSMLIDGNYHFIAAYIANAQLTSGSVKTGGVFGFIRTVKAAIDKFKPELVYVAWDRQPCWRDEVYSGYKKSRKEKAASLVDAGGFDFTRQKKLIMEKFLPSMGINQVSAPGFEADDIAYDWATNQDGHKILMSGDEDWIQLVDDNNHVWVSRKDTLVTPENFSEITGCNDMSEFMNMRGITGQKGDDIPGVKGVGDSFALKYLRGELKSGVKLDSILSWVNDPNGFKLSMKLFDLQESVKHYPGGCIPIEIVEGHWDESRFGVLCDDQGFNSIIGSMAKWRESFGLSS